MSASHRQPHVPSSPGRHAHGSANGGPVAEGRFANVTGAVLLGGASERMGRDKTRLELDGEALATRAARLLHDLTEEVLLVGDDPPPDAPGRVVTDCAGPRSSLRGLVSALDAASTEQLLVVAADLPLVSPEILLALLARGGGDAVVPRNAEGLQPLCALYARERTLPVARRRLEEGRLSVRGLLDSLDVALLEGPDLERVDPSGHGLDNVNTPEEWEALRRRHRGDPGTLEARESGHRPPGH